MILDLRLEIHDRQSVDLSLPLYSGHKLKMSAWKHPRARLLSYLAWDAIHSHDFS